LWLFKNLSLMEKSLVGDPIQWPGLVYSPLNPPGLIFALGAIAGSIGLLFEEFSDDGATAICRRKTAYGRERIRVAFAVYSSSYVESGDGADLLICWIDDFPQLERPPRLVLPDILSSAKSEGSLSVSRGLDSILPENAAQDLLERGASRESYEETVRLLDEQIKKLQNG
jgi:hypothetical protein